MTHPYFIEKAIDALAKASASTDHPEELAQWAEGAEPAAIAIITAAGKVVGTGKYVDARGLDLKVVRIDKATLAKYDVMYGRIDFALSEIGDKIGEPVVLVKRSQFVGASKHQHN